MTLLIDYIVSLTNLYGLVHKEKVVEIYNMQNEKLIDVTKMDEVVQENRKELSDDFVEMYGNYFVHESIIHFDEIEEELAKKKGKPFYVPWKSELLKYKDDFYYEKTKEFKKLLQYVTKNITEGNKYKAEEICEDIQLTCQDDFMPQHIFNEFDRRNITLKDEKQVREVLDLVMNLANNTRIWANNGYTPHEMFEKFEKPHFRNLPTSAGSPFISSNKPDLTVIPGGAAKKIGRNDPCPCGSGKKYKKCCLDG